MAVPHLECPLIPNFQVLVDGSPLPVELEPLVLDIAVDNDTALPGMFSIAFTGDEIRQDQIEWIDDEQLFAVGRTVEVKLGYEDDLERVIVGEITALEPEFSFHELPRLTLRGYDRRHRLQRGLRTRTFVQQKDSDIAALIAREAGLRADTVDTTVVHEHVMQGNQTDMEFLQERAQRIHYELLIDDFTLHYRPVSNDDEDVITLRREDDLIEFSPRLTSIGQVSEFQVCGWNPREKEAILGTARTGDENAKMAGKEFGGKMSAQAFGDTVHLATNHQVKTQAEADQLAKAGLNVAALGLITGEGMCLGRTDLRPGSVIKIEGVGQKFSGKYYVTSVTHRYSSHQSFNTHFSIRRNAS